MFVDSKITLGALFEKNACFHLSAHKHHRSPDETPEKLYSGTGSDKLLPTDLLNSKNSSVIIEQTVCNPKSFFSVLQ